MKVTILVTFLFSGYIQQVGTVLRVETTSVKTRAISFAAPCIINKNQTFANNEHMYALNKYLKVQLLKYGQGISLL